MRSTDPPRWPLHPFADPVQLLQDALLARGTARRALLGTLIEMETLASRHERVPALLQARYEEQLSLMQEAEERVKKLARQGEN